MTLPPSLPLDQWLEWLGFVRGNPFATMVAEQERSLLPMFFVHVDGYDLVQSDRSVVVFAPRGCGKSALRVQLASAAAPMNPDAARLAVEYTDFDALIAASRQDRPITADDHLPTLVRAGVEALFKALCGDPDADGMSTFAPEWASRARRAAALPIPGRARLAQLIGRYAPELLDLDRVAATLWALAPVPVLRSASSLGQLRAIALRPPLADNPIAALVADLLDPPPIGDHEKPPTATVTTLVRLARAAGFHAVMFLVDRLDEYPETAARPDVQADIIESLLAHLPLIELPGASFKFFLSREARDHLLQRPSIRRDRLTDQAVTVEWSVPRLKRLLDERLSVFSDERIGDLIQICEEAPQGASSGATIEHEMLLTAHGSPRRLLMLGQLMLLAHVQRAGSTGYLSREDWETARAVLLQLMPPTLHVRRDSRTVVVGSKAVELKLMPYKVLLSLAEARGRCSREALVQAAWGVGQGVSDDAVNQTISRLREALGDDARRPIYLKLDRQTDSFELSHFALE